MADNFIPILDFSDVIINDGDTDKLVIKVNKITNRLQAWSNDLNAFRIENLDATALSITGGNMFGSVRIFADDPNITLDAAYNTSASGLYLTNTHGIAGAIYREASGTDDNADVGDLYISRNNSLDDSVTASLRLGDGSSQLTGAFDVTGKLSILGNDFVVWRNDGNNNLVQDVNYGNNIVTSYQTHTGYSKPIRVPNVDGTEDGNTVPTLDYLATAIADKTGFQVLSTSNSGDTDVIVSVGDNPDAYIGMRDISAGDGSNAVNKARINFLPSNILLDKPITYALTVPADNDSVLTTKSFVDSQDDLKYNKTGGIISGDISIDKSNPAIAFYPDAGSNGQVKFYNSGSNLSAQVYYRDTLNDLVITQVSGGNNIILSDTTVSFNKDVRLNNAGTSVASAVRRDYVDSEIAALDYQPSDQPRFTGDLFLTDTALAQFVIRSQGSSANAGSQIIFQGSSNNDTYANLFGLQNRFILRHSHSTGGTDTDLILRDDYIEASKEVRAGVVGTDDSSLTTVKQVRDGYVSLDTDQDIDGVKRFTENPAIDSAAGNPALVFERNGVDTMSLFGVANYNIIRRHDSSGTTTNQIFIRDTFTEFFNPIRNIQTVATDHDDVLTTKGFIDSSFVSLDTNQIISGAKTLQNALSVTGATNGGIVNMQFAGTNQGRIIAYDGRTDWQRIKADNGIGAALRLYDDSINASVSINCSEPTVDSDGSGILTTKGWVEAHVAANASGGGTTYNGGTVTTDIEVEKAEANITLDATTGAPRVTFLTDGDQIGLLYGDTGNNIMRLQKRNADGAVENELQIRTSFTLLTKPMRYSTGTDALATNDNDLIYKKYVDDLVADKSGAQIISTSNSTDSQLIVSTGDGPITTNLTLRDVSNGDGANAVNKSRISFTDGAIYMDKPHSNNLTVAADSASVLVTKSYLDSEIAANAGTGGDPYEEGTVSESSDGNFKLLSTTDSSKAALHYVDVSNNGFVSQNLMEIYAGNFYFREPLQCNTPTTSASADSVLVTKGFLDSEIAANAGGGGGGSFDGGTVGQSITVATTGESAELKLSSPIGHNPVLKFQVGGVNVFQLFVDNTNYATRIQTFKSDASKAFDLVFSPDRLELDNQATFRAGRRTFDYDHPPDSLQ